MAKREELAFIGGETDSVRGILVGSANFGDRNADVVAAGIIAASNKLTEGGHTVLHFVGIGDPRDGYTGPGGQILQQTLVAGQHPRLSAS